MIGRGPGGAIGNYRALRSGATAERPGVSMNNIITTFSRYKNGLLGIAAGTQIASKNWIITCYPETRGGGIRHHIIEMDYD